ncbi:unnamed protein product [Didymodactylos carnosus]|uniref:Uncharacterized protein n=1 Tax=Didymodactylos carnosus TaxID=1234261 RepID=A0A814TJ98_9BILA|nr:unnamed protein product [Didymodactylos carnosus]CAF3923961.1 unnamed protein product [Didymodactylos carnosus]
MKQNNFNLSYEQILARQTRLIQVKRQVRSSSVDSKRNERVLSFEQGQNVTYEAANFSYIQEIFVNDGINITVEQIKSHTSWLVRNMDFTNDMEIQSIKRTEIARWDNTKQQFILNQTSNQTFVFDSYDQLILINSNVDDVYNEISLRVQSGITDGDDILHITYRLVMISSKSTKCPTTITMKQNEQQNITCKIEYNYVKYDGVGNMSLPINFTFYSKYNNSYTQINQNDIIIEDFQTNAGTSVWYRKIIYLLQADKQLQLEYVCAVIPDTIRNNDNFNEKQILNDPKRSCRILINIKKNEDTTSIPPLPSKYPPELTKKPVDGETLKGEEAFKLLPNTSKTDENLLNIPQIVSLSTKDEQPMMRQETPKQKGEFQSVSSFPRCPSSAYIPPQSSTKPISTAKSLRQQQSNNERRHKPGCPKYIPASEYNLISDEVFTQTGPDTIQKIILPDVVDDDNRSYSENKNTNYIRLYLPDSSTHKIINIRPLQDTPSDRRHESFVSLERLSPQTTDNNLSELIHSPQDTRRREVTSVNNLNNRRQRVQHRRHRTEDSPTPKIRDLYHRHSRSREKRAYSAQSSNRFIKDKQKLNMEENAQNLVHKTRHL